jgi:alkenylglycerophosphocholine hydrolase
MFPNFEGVLIFGVPIYMTLLLTMAWRANARLQSSKNLPKLLAGLGGLFFVISDGLIGFDKFYTPIKYSKVFIMITYYIAQLGITLSVLDHEIVPVKMSKSK